MENQKELRALADYTISVCVFLKLRQASRATSQLLGEILKPCGLLATQFPILVNLALVDRSIIKDLAEQLVMDSTTLSRNLKILEKKGFVEGGPGEDRRMREVWLSPEGKEVLEKAFPLWEHAHSYIAEGLGQDRMRLLVKDLSETITHVQHH